VTARDSDSIYADYVTNACKGVCIYVRVDCHVCGNAPPFGAAAYKNLSAIYSFSLSVRSVFWFSFPLIMLEIKITVASGVVKSLRGCEFTTNLVEWSHYLGCSFSGLLN